MNQKKSLKKSLLVVAIMPILSLGLIITFFSMQKFTSAMHREVESELSNMAYAVNDMLDIQFPGDYVKYGEKVLTLVKGESILNDRFEYIDAIKEDTGLEVSILYENIRFLTTIQGSEGERMLATFCHALVQKEVLESGSSKFYNNVVIGENKFFAYYLPLFNSDGKCVGMIEVAKPADEVNKMIRQSIWPIVLIAVIVMIVTGFATVRYAAVLIEDLTRLKDFMKDIARGNLKKEFDYHLMKRNDEITDMYESAADMQKSLRELIELDALTQLENRRSANNNIRALHRKLEDANEKYVLVLGDIDFFKKVNDTYGHDAGDAVLKQVAFILKTSMKGKGFAARWGGEEFLLGFKGYTVERAAQETERILEEVRNSVVECNDNKISVTMSFGVAKGKKGASIDSIIKEADDKLYFAKTNGRNQVVSYLEGESRKEDAGGSEDARNHVPVDEDVLDYIKELKGESDGAADEEQYDGE